MTFSSSITFTKDNLNSQQNIVHNIEYKHTVYSGDELWATFYNNKTDSNGTQETFNKLYKNGDDIFEKIGNSQNKDSWKIKEFLNTILKKQYVVNYPDNNFNGPLLSDIYDNIHNNKDEKNILIIL